MLFTPSHLHNALAQIGVTCPGDIFERLAIAYSEPWRHYHTQSHIQDCLSKLTDFNASLIYEDALKPIQLAVIEISLYFHDAVYVPRRDDNEVLSAQWARCYLESKGSSLQTIDQISKLILATNTHQSTDLDTAILLDIDLSILGAPAHQFRQYDARIRQEYSWLPTLEYNRARCRILENFLKREQIYITAYFQEQYETQARINLTNWVSNLDHKC